MKKIYLIPLLLLASAFMPVAKDVKLEYSFKLGDQYDWVQNTDQKIVQSFEGMTQEIESHIEGLTNLKISELTSSGAKVEIQYSKIVYQTKTAQGGVSMDSESDTTKMENRLMRSLTGKKFYFYMSKNGTVEKIEGADKLWSGISRLGMDETNTAIMKQLLEKAFGEEAIKKNLEAVLISYPDKKVKQGDTWKNSTGAPMNFPLQTDNVWEVTTLDKKNASLKGTGTINTTDKTKAITLPGNFKSKLDLSGTQSVTSQLEVASGWPSEFKISSNIKGTMMLLAGGPIPQDMNVPIEIVTTSTFKFIKK